MLDDLSTMYYVAGQPQQVIKQEQSSLINNKYIQYDAFEVALKRATRVYYGFNVSFDQLMFFSVLTGDSNEQSN
jgi:hypothetical protein